MEHCSVAGKAQAAAGVRLKDTLEPVGNKSGEVCWRELEIGSIVTLRARSANSAAF